jgi:zeta-carotene desaturase
MKALIMGGGMSGLATAVNLLEQGIEVEIIEADEIFGGRANSWLDEDGDMIDNALHVFLPYYVNLVAFFRKMGIEGNLLWRKPEYHYPQDNGEDCVMRFPNLPTPLHSASAFLGMIKNYKAVSRMKMILSSLAMAGLMGISKDGLDKMDEVSWAEWTGKRGPKGAFKHFDPAVHGLTFTEPHSMSAKVMASWINKLMAGPEYSFLAFANGGLGEIWVESCLNYIKSKGGTFETKKAVTAINIANGKISDVVVNGKEKRTADLYISAMSPYALRKLIPKECFKYSYFQDICYFENAPSLSIQVWLDKSITDCDVLMMHNDCIFSCTADLANILPHIFKGGSMMEMVLTPADHLVHMPDETIFERTMEDLKRLFPEARTAKVKKYKVVRERQGVYRAYPGMEKHRPYQRSPFDNFYLTGDWTSTPVSSGGMEAAIWTANHCAEVIMQDKFKKSISLNIDFNPPKGLLPLVKPSMYAGGAAIVWVFLRLVAALATKLVR